MCLNGWDPGRAELYIRPTLKELIINLVTIIIFQYGNFNRWIWVSPCRRWSLSQF